MKFNTGQWNMRWNGNVSKVLYTNYQDPYFRFRSEALHWTIPDNFEYVDWRFDWWSTCPVNLRLRFRILLANFYHNQKTFVRFWSIDTCSLLLLEIRLVMFVLAYTKVSVSITVYTTLVPYDDAFISFFIFWKRKQMTAFLP